jgi:hypothetical protein
MPIFQTEILSASDVCSNCLARQRREVSRGVDSWGDEHTYSERCRWQTIVEDVPGPVVHEAGTLFCDCGAPGPYTRIWDSRDLDADRRTALILAAIDTLRAKGYRVDTRAFADAVVDALPPAGKLAPHRKDVVNEAFATAAASDAVVATPDPATAPASP